MGRVRPDRRGMTEKMVTNECQSCGKAFQVIPSRAKHGRGKSCSPACQYEARRNRPKRAVVLVCVGCGVSYTRPPSQATGNKGKFCTRACRDENRVRESHPQYLGRPTDVRGPNWQATRRAARKRDNRTCQHCGALGTDVHHIKPFRLFHNHRDANNLANLVTLCRPCHRRADIELQRAERRRLSGSLGDIRSAMARFGAALKDLNTALENLNRAL